MLKSILVLEESLIVHQLFESALPHDICNWKVFHESKSENFISQASEVLPDIIFLSNRDQERKYECLKALREDEHLKKIPVILLTTGKDRLDERFLVSLGVFGFIRKPFEASTLREQIEALFEDSRYENLQSPGKELDNLQVVDEDLLSIMSGESSDDISIDELETELDPTQQFVEVKESNGGMEPFENELLEIEDENTNGALLEEDPSLELDDSVEILEVEEDDAETELIEVEDFEDEMDMDSSIEDEFDSYEVKKSDNTSMNIDSVEEGLYEIPVHLKVTASSATVQNVAVEGDSEGYMELEIITSDEFEHEANNVEENSAHGTDILYDGDQNIEDSGYQVEEENSSDDLQDDHFDNSENDFFSDDEIEDGLKAVKADDETILPLFPIKEDAIDESSPSKDETVLPLFPIKSEVRVDTPQLKDETILPLFPIKESSHIGGESGQQENSLLEDEEDSSSFDLNQEEEENENFEIEFGDENDIVDDFDLNALGEQSPESLSANIQQMISLRQVAKAKYDIEGEDEVDVLEEEEDAGFEIEFDEQNEEIPVFPVEDDFESETVTFSEIDLSVSEKTESVFPAYRPVENDEHLPLFPMAEFEQTGEIIESGMSDPFVFPEYQTISNDPHLPLFPIVEMKQENGSISMEIAEDSNLESDEVVIYDSLEEEGDEAGIFASIDESDLNDGEDIDLLAEIEEEDDSDLLVEEDDSDLLVEEDDSDLLVEEDDSDLLVEEDDSDLLVEEDDSDLLVEEDDSDLLVEEDDSDLLVEEDDSDLLVEEDDSDLLVEEDDSDLLVEEDDSDLLVEEDDSDLLVEEDDSDLLVEEDDSDLLVEEDDSDLLVEDIDLLEDIEETEQDLVTSDETLFEDTDSISLLDHDEDEDTLETGEVELSRLGDTGDSGIFDTLNEDGIIEQKQAEFPLYEPAEDPNFPLFPLHDSSNSTLSSDSADLDAMSMEGEEILSSGEDSFEEIELLSVDDEDMSEEVLFEESDIGGAEDNEVGLLAVDEEDSLSLEDLESSDMEKDSELEEIDLLSEAEDQIGDESLLEEEEHDLLMEGQGTPVLDSEMQMIDDEEEVVIEVSEDVFNMDDFSMKRVQEEDEEIKESITENKEEPIKEEKSEEEVEKNASDDYKQSLETMIQGIITKSIQTTLNEVLPEMVEKIMHEDAKK